MKRCEFQPISIDDLPAMADLLIQRQNAEAEVFPFLKNSCLNKEYTTDLLRNLLNHKKVIGVGAFTNHELVGYLIGEIKIDTLRGRHIWVPYEGIAIRMDQSSELIRNLYAKVSVKWLEQGCFMHYTIIPLGNQVYYDAYQRLSFFIQQVHGVLNIGDYKPFEHVSDIEIKIADKMDSEMMGKMSSIIQSYQNSTPTFEPALPEVVSNIHSAYKSIVEEDDPTCLIASKDMKEVGFQVYDQINTDLMTPDNGVELSIAGTSDSQMGKGVGKRLMNEGYRIMKEKGYNSIVTDWRITNLASSTFWPKCGFMPVAYRMVRSIDSHIAWANFNNPSIKLL
ncbi:GNAT family N-acetyltransferase [Ferdinandcohnia quinoae]|uniref:GNAT family N-acetyltransferase n=1 Tax=Fredinandcohnia quinoae TaxID=2918902 RepID=A0AAW5DVQ4_9BACI|nr:GNAT family N-acetyltransferase [Fredinandcohnia sp. SECRCQ15]MCH1624428.1 GNAT family N-acetyltransferase [Fredinandcohnia sp. SECRCQ15]